MEIQIKCTNCIHCETAYYQDDNMCVPQRFSSSDPRSVSDNIACKYYVEAERERTRAGLYGIISYKLVKEDSEWDPKCPGHNMRNRVEV